MYRIVSLIPADVDQPAPKWDGPGVSAIKEIGGIVLAGGLGISVIAIIVAGAMIAGGHIWKQQRVKELGIQGVIGGVIGAAVMGGAAALINFGFGIKL